jgi:hypothetical protein
VCKPCGDSTEPTCDVGENLCISINKAKCKDGTWTIVNPRPNVMMANSVSTVAKFQQFCLLRKQHLTLYFYSGDSDGSCKSKPEGPNTKPNCEGDDSLQCIKYEAIQLKDSSCSWECQASPIECEEGKTCELVLS